MIDAPKSQGRNGKEENVPQVHSESLRLSQWANLCWINKKWDAPLAVALERNRVTVQDWLRLYREGGIQKLLDIKQPPGKVPLIPQWAVDALQKKLQEPEGFKSYKQVQIWLRDTLGIDVSYFVVHDLVYYKLRAKLKVPRPKSSKQDPKLLESLQANLGSDLELLSRVLIEQFGHLYQRIRYWCEDESRFGLHTVPGLKLTAIGVKPIGTWQWKFQAFWLYGVVEPLTIFKFFF